MAERKPLYMGTEGFPAEVDPAADAITLAGLTITTSAGIAMGGFKITNLGAPTADGDASTKGYVDSLVQGLDIKASVDLATVAALPAVTPAGTGVGKTLTADANGALSVDGVAVVVGDRILVKDQAAQDDNGIYTVTATGDGSNPFILTRATDFDENDEVTAGSFMFIERGNTLADTGWVLTTNDAITVDTTSLVFAQFSSAGVITGGAGILKTGNVLDVELDTDADAQGAGADGGSSGLEFDTSGAAGQLRAKVDPAGGIQRGASGLLLELAAAGALEVGAGGLSVRVDGTTIAINGSNNLEVQSVDDSQRIENTFVAQGALALADAVYATTTNNDVAEADAANNNTRKFVGIVMAAAADNDPVRVTSYGLAKAVLTGATAGDFYYVAVGGGISTTRPTGTGQHVLLVGKAMNATDLMVTPQYLGLAV